MKINLIFFLASSQEPEASNTRVMMMKTVEASFRPVKGDIIDDPGFDSDFHNGYEVVKVTLDYSAGHCWVSLAPLQVKREEMPSRLYKQKLEKHGWEAVTKEEMLHL